MRKTLLALVSTILLLATAGFANAQQFVGLGSTGLTLSFYTASNAVPTTVPVLGLNAGDTLIGIDYFSSSNGLLYGLGTSGTLYTLSNLGVATVSTTSTITNATAIDFNPAANRLRVFAGTSNFRLTPGTGVTTSDGTLAYAAGDVNAAATPNLVAAAYTNNFAGSATTTLYSIDATLNILVMNTIGPAFSTLNTVGTLMLNGVVFDALAGVTGFDVFSLQGGNVAYLSSVNQLYTIDLATAVLTSVGTLAGPDIRDLAAIPEPSTYALIAVGGALALFAFARRRQDASA